MRWTTSSPARPGDGFEPLEPRLLLCASTALFADLAGDLDAWWRFDEVGVAAIADESASAAAHTGTLNGAAGVSAFGRCGGSGDFAGGEMNVANHSDINLGTNTQRTIAMWFLAEDVDAPGRQMLYEEGGGTRGLNIYLDGGRLFVGGWNRAESGWQGTWLSTGAVSSGRWHHITLTLDGGPTTQPDALHGYLDGQHFAGGEGSQLWSHSGDVTIGGIGDTLFPDGSGGAAAFIGHLDDIRLYNRALSAYDVSVLGGAFNEGAALALATDDRASLLEPPAVASDPGDTAQPDPPQQQSQTVPPAQLDRETPVPAQPAPYAAPGVDQSPASAPTPEPTAAEPQAGPAQAATTPQAPSSPQQDAQTDRHTQPDDGSPPPDPRIAEVETDPKSRPKSPSDTPAALNSPNASAPDDAASAPRHTSLAPARED